MLFGQNILMQILDEEELPHKGFAAAGQSWAALSIPHLNTSTYIRAVALVGHLCREEH